VDGDRQGQADGLGPQTVAGTPVQGTDAQPLATRREAAATERETSIIDEGKLSTSKMCGADDRNRARMASLEDRAQGVVRGLDLRKARATPTCY
jgi:hypothetical protein